MDRHDLYWEHLTGYVTGELPAELRAQIEAHMTGCADCALEARELSRAFDAVGLSTAWIAPPAAVKVRLMAGLASERVTSHTPFTKHVRSHVTSDVSAAAHPRLRLSRRFSPAWLVAAAALLVVFGGMLVLSQQRVARVLDERRAAEESIARLTDEAATVATQADLAVAILTAPDMRRIDLQGFDVSRDATARAYWSGAKGLLIVADRLPAPPPGRQYQVWLIGAGAPGPVSAGLIDGRSGRGMLIVPPPGGMPGRSLTVAVTDEPAGGLPAPSGSKHLVGSI